MTATIVVATAVVGLLVGSFLNVVIWRVPRDESIVTPPSHCPRCERRIRPYDNVPVVSYLLLRGRCRHCAAPISPRYPAVEALTAVVFAAVAARVGTTPALAGFLVFAAVGIAQAGIDLDTKRLPFKVTNVAYAAGLAILAISAFTDGTWWPYARAVIGMAALYAFYDVIAFIQPRGMGGGDVHLAGAIGLYLGWLGWSSLAVGAFLGFLIGGVVGIGLMLAGRAGRKTAIPFGPYMLCGALVAVLAGQQLGHAYLHVTFG